MGKSSMDQILNFKKKKTENAGARKSTAEISRKGVRTLHSSLEKSSTKKNFALEELMGFLFQVYLWMNIRRL